MITRRAAARLIVATAAAAALGAGGQALAADKVPKIGVGLSLTGADAESATRILHGAQLAFEDANAAGVALGYTFQAVSFDNGTATAGQYDPAQAATNARKMVSEREIIAAIGVLGPEMLTALGFPAAEGSPHMTDDTEAAELVPHYKAKFGVPPDDCTFNRDFPERLRARRPWP
jgi:ABC-type branched-subunit amino acid transport system substrate-binding protein